MSALATILTSLIGAGLFGAIGTIVTLMLRQPMARAEVTEKLEDISRRALERMERDLAARLTELEECREQVPVLKARLRELDADLAVMRTRHRELEAEVRSRRASGTRAKRTPGEPRSSD